MKRTPTLSSVLVLLVSCLGVCGKAQALLINGDFAAGFDAWRGEVTDLGFVTTDVDPLPGTFPVNFDASSGAAALATTTLTDGVFSVFMFQDFTMDVGLPGESLILSLDLELTLTDPGLGDTGFAQLNYDEVGGVFLDTLDLLAGGSFDVTALSGQSVQLLFGVEDFDDGVDQLRVDNIRIAHVPNAVPAPSSALLLLAACGLVVPVALLRRRLPDGTD